MADGSAPKPLKMPASSAGACPVKHGTVKMPASGAGECPVPHGARKKVYNVYSQEIDPSNNMPASVGATQLPVPGQAAPLTTDRVQSTIPKGNTEETWTYPSPQMFFNALHRKGKGGDVTEADAEVIVAIHNNMNERTWAQVMEWEAPHAERCPNPALLKFKGRPDELSPLARWKVMTGGPRPFDRHDWVVDRCGTAVRYVIDYYHDEDKDKDLEGGMPLPHASDRRVESISMVVRPALDSPGAVWDRVKHAMGLAATPPAPAPPAAPQAPAVPPAVHKVFPDTKLDDAEFKFLSSLDGPKVAALHETIHSKCQRHLEAAHAADATPTARLGLDYCVGSVVAPEAAEALMAALEAGAPDAEEAAYDRLQVRLQRFGVMSRKVAESLEVVE